MKKQRKGITKSTKYILVCIAIIISEIGGIIVRSASIFEVIALNLIVFVPILIKKYKYETDFGTILIGGLIRGAIWLAVWVAMIYISKDNPLLDKIVSWPIGF